MLYFNELLSRDACRRVGDGPGRTVRMGVVLQGGDQAREQLLRREQHRVAVLSKQVVPWPRTHPALMVRDRPCMKACI